MPESPFPEFPEDQLQKLKQRLTRVAYRQLGDLAEDLVQETLFCFFENLHQGKYRGGNTYPEYFCYALGILKVIIIKEIKNKQQLRSRLHPDSPGDLEERLVFDEGQSGEKDMLQREADCQTVELAARARQVFERFPPEIQQMIYFHVVENWSYTRLSRHFGIPKQTLVSRFNAAMDKMRRKLRFHHTKPGIEYLPDGLRKDVQK
jgi:RNA polymerase sigma factor (sigma-70 family)